MKTKADDEDDIDDPPPEGLPGNVSPGGHDALAAGILSLSGEVLQLIVLVKEASPEEFRAVEPRLKMFLNLVSQVPTVASPGKSIGFKVKPKHKKGKGKR